MAPKLLFLHDNKKLPHQMINKSKNSVSLGPYGFIAGLTSCFERARYYEDFQFIP